MRRVLTLTSTTVGKKIVMAITGIVLVGFVIGHMVGNLKIYMGSHDGLHALDHYAEGLRTFGAPFLAETQFLWLFRAILVVSIALHVWAAISLKHTSMAARPTGYRKTGYEESTLASRTMIFGGIVLALFVIFHLLHFTTGDVTPGFVFEHGAVFANVTGGLGVAWVAAFYVLASLALALHLYHGVWSMLQTLGANNPRYNHWRRRLALGLALALAVGNISIPVAVLTGMIH